MKSRDPKLNAGFCVLALWTVSLLAGCNDNAPRSVVDSSDQAAIREYKANQQKAETQMMNEEPVAE